MLLAKSCNKLLRIAFITPEFVSEPNFSGGLANYLGRVTIGLCQQGHGVHVFTPAHDNARYMYGGVTVHRVRAVWDRRMVIDHIDSLVPRKFYNVYQDVKAAWCLFWRWRNVSKKIRFDLVQVANVAAVGLFFQFEGRMPVITRMSSYRPTWDSLAGIPATAGVRARWWLEKLAVKRTSLIYAPSRYIADKVRTAYRIPEVHVIPPPFFREETAPDFGAYNEFGRVRKYALFFGRMTRMKGIPILAEALPEALERCPDMHMILVGPDWSGPGCSSMKNYIRRKLDGSLSRIHILDSMRHDKLYPFIQNARFVVLPSLADNLPNTCLESMGLGKVVIATTGSCFEDLIVHERSGFLVPPGDSKALANQMIATWRLEDAALERIGSQAKAKCAEFHPDSSLEKLIGFYCTALGVSQSR